MSFLFSFARKIVADDIIRKIFCRRVRLGNNLSATENKSEAENQKNICDRKMSFMFSFARKIVVDDIIQKYFVDEFV